MFFYAKLYDKLPMYLLVFMAFTAVILIMKYIKRKMKITKLKKDMWLDISHLTLLWDILLRLLLASIYVFGVAGFGFDVFNYWLGIVMMLFISWLGLFLFYKNKFDSENPNKAVNVIAIIIKLFAFGGLFYIRTIVPNTADKNLYIQVF